MTTHADQLSQFSSVAAPRSPVRAAWCRQFHDNANRVGARIVKVLESCGAVILYKELSKLSDAELERRGVARGDLHRHVFETLNKR
jgi:hypothetical protein